MFAPEACNAMANTNTRLYIQLALVTIMAARHVSLLRGLCVLAAGFNARLKNHFFPNKLGFLKAINIIF